MSLPKDYDEKVQTLLTIFVTDWIEWMKSLIQGI